MEQQKILFGCVVSCLLDHYFSPAPSIAKPSFFVVVYVVWCGSSAGTPSNVKRFAQSSPIIIDACIEGFTWAKSGTKCTANIVPAATDCGKTGGSCTPGSFPSDKGIITANIKYNLPDQIPTQREESTSANKKQLLLWGRYLVFNGKIENDALSVHLNSIARNDFLLPPKPFVDDLRCISVTVFGLDSDGNCEAGCGVLCDLPSGQGKDNIITIRSEKERISNGHFRLDYEVPTLDKTVFDNIPTFGDPNLFITGTNFGLNATVKVGNVQPVYEVSTGKCVCSGTLVCGYDTSTTAASFSTGSRGCFLQKIQQTHSSIRVVLPSGIGRNIQVILSTVNQYVVATLNFAPPTIDTKNSGPLLVSTVGTEIVTLKGQHFGAHPLVADTYQIGATSHLEVESALGLQKSDTTTTTTTTTTANGRRTAAAGSSLKILFWDHTTIRFQVPEGDGTKWAIRVNSGSQVVSFLNALNYMKPNIKRLVPNAGVMTDGTDGGLIVGVDVATDGRGTLVHKSGFLLQPPAIGDVITIYHCDEKVDGSYFVTHNYRNNNSLTFKKPGNPGQVFTRGSWAGGFVSGGKPVKLTITGTNFGVRQVEVMLNGALFYTFQATSGSIGSSSGANGASGAGGSSNVNTGSAAFMTWNFTIASATITQDQDVTVTQGTQATGNLSVALTGAGMTEIIIRSFVGQLFNQAADLIVGTKTVVQADLIHPPTSITTAATTPATTTPTRTAAAAATGSTTPIRTHETLVLSVPAGIGTNLVVTVRVGQQTSTATTAATGAAGTGAGSTSGGTTAAAAAAEEGDGIVMSYLPPHLFSISPEKLSTLACTRFESPFEWEQRVSKEFSATDRLNQLVGTGPKCVQPAKLTIQGMSLGCLVKTMQVSSEATGGGTVSSLQATTLCRTKDPLEVTTTVGQFTATNGPFKVCNARKGCALDRSTPFLGTDEDAFGHQLPTQTHTDIAVFSPVGSGHNNSFQLTVAGQLSNNITLFYKPPIITATNLKPYDARGPVSFGNPDRYNGKAILEIRGEEFGGVQSQVKLAPII